MVRLGTILQWVALGVVSAGCHSPTTDKDPLPKRTDNPPIQPNNPPIQPTTGPPCTGFAFPDADGDDHAPVDASAISVPCTGGHAPLGYSGNLGDCDDANPNAFNTYYLDADGDGVSVEQHTICAGAEAPAGYARDPGSDCDDTDAAVSHRYVFDADGDGHVLPNAATVCGPADHVPPNAAGAYYEGDCDDNDPTVSVVYYQDLDGDGFAASDEVSKCGSPEMPPPGFGVLSPRPDCDDTNAAVSPGALELWTDNIDSDCDGFLGYPFCPDGSCDPYFVPVPIDAACASADLFIASVSSDPNYVDVKWVVVIANQGTAPLSELTLTIQSSTDTISYEVVDPFPPGVQRSYYIPRGTPDGEVRFSVTTPAADCNPANDTATASDAHFHDSGGERVP